MNDLPKTPDPSDFVFCLQITAIEFVKKRTKLEGSGRHSYLVYILACQSRGLVRNFNPRVPQYNTSKILRVPLALFI